MRMKTIAIIPAKGASAGLKNKNILALCGKPLIAWTIEAAIASKCFDKIVVSTDSDRIELIAKGFPIECYRHRKELSALGKPTFPVIQHFAEHLKSLGSPVDTVVVLRVTSPTRTASDIRKALRLFRQSTVDSLVSVEPVQCHPMRLKTMTKAGVLLPIERGEEHAPIPRQALPTVYRRTGGIYITKLRVILSGSWFGRSTIGYVSTRENGININDKFDLLIAEHVLQTRNASTD